jgi:hypothetical protein
VKATPPSFSFYSNNINSSFPFFLISLFLSLLFLFFLLFDFLGPWHTKHTHTNNSWRRREKMYEGKKDKTKDYSLGLHGAAMNGNVG